MSRTAHLLLAAAFVATPAAAERWREMPGAPNARLAIDLDSIRREGPWRVFRTRTTVPGLKGTIIGTVAMDCKAGITELRAQRGYAEGVLKRERVFPSGKRPRQKLPNPAADPAFKIVCAA
ncbi:hypothetical protein [Sphingomonas turrisvirgatae]|uniref:Uncharacterized protein n=1 Tax=Sphingomonas turrisvirgatae TaxID=1888892 RepID=A0A1E3LXG6_9SPHN|nr:hypothetical protein [Sphingomonas turrisvirgatae]ODP38487.1 hypothetical protein BFL28_00020 [Sphingomonas turrisvirgatae]